MTHDDLQHHFSDNMLDGDDIQGQMLAATEVFEYLLEVVANAEQRARIQVLRDITENWHHRSFKRYILDVYNNELKELKSQLSAQGDT